MEEMFKVSEVKLTYNTKVKSSERVKIQNSEDVYKLLVSSVYDSETIQYREYVKLLLLDRSCKVLGVVPISEGGLNQAMADVRIILQAAILGNASGIILT